MCCDDECVLMRMVRLFSVWCGVCERLNGRIVDEGMGDGVESSRML